VLFAAAATLIGAIVVFRWLPAHGTDADGIPAATPTDEIAGSVRGGRARRPGAVPSSAARSGSTAR
jgi:hypothetical protein